MNHTEHQSLTIFSWGFLTGSSPKTQLTSPPTSAELSSAQQRTNKDMQTQTAEISAPKRMLRPSDLEGLPLCGRGFSKQSMTDLKHRFWWPCEDQLDTPLLYTNGWGKKLSYVLGFSVPEGPVDVSRRYLGKKFDEASVRRTEVGEDWLQDALEKGRQMVWTQCAVPVAKIASLRQQLQDEDLELQVSSLRPNIPGF